MKKYISILSAFIIFFLSLNSFKPVDSKIGNMLSYQMENTSKNNFTVYVYLNDKGPNVAQYLANPLSLVSQRSLDRRAKVLPQGQLVSYTDVPLYENYINAISQNVTKVRHLLNWFNAMSVEVSREQINTLKSLDCVTKIEAVETYVKRKNDEESVSQNVNAINSPQDNIMLDSLTYGPSLRQDTLIKVNQVHNQGIYGQGIIIGHFDAGFTNLNHECFTTLPMKILRKKDFHTGDTVNIAVHSHGQATLSLVGGYKPGSLIGPAFQSSFILCRTEVDPTETPVEMDHWAAAAQWVDSLGADIITSSLGYLTFDSPYTSYTWQDMNGHTLLITNAARIAARHGILVSNSAGNDGENTSHNTLGGPADADSILTVGATNSSGVKASYSSVGPTTDIPARIKPDVMAQGSGNQVADQTGYNTFGSGTSWACPMNAGACALVLSANKSLTPMQIIGIMKKFANNSASPNNLIGWGLINTKLAVDSARKLDNVAPVITHTQQGNTPNTGVITLKTKITDNGIIRSWVNEAPRMYYRKYTGGSWSAYTAVNAYYAQRDSFFFQIPGSAGGTQIEYYFAAQDIALPTPNLKTLPAGGSGVNPPGTTPPATRFSFTITGVGNNISTLPAEFKLYNNFPNPFNPVTRIKFDLPKSSIVKLSVYDILGREVQSILNGNFEAGYYEINFDGSNLSSGIYFYKLQASDFTDVKKMILNK
jgi:serine protease AprX